MRRVIQLLPRAAGLAVESTCDGLLQSRAVPTALPAIGELSQRSVSTDSSIWLCCPAAVQLSGCDRSFASAAAPTSSFPLGHLSSLNQVPADLSRAGKSSSLQLSALLLQARQYATRQPSRKEQRRQQALERDRHRRQQDATAAQAAAAAEAQRPEEDVRAPNAHQPASAAGSEMVPSESHADAKEVANVVGREALIITRNIEWGTVILGFEQCNKYTVLDQDGNTVALLAEDAGGIGTAVGRQMLRRRRPLTATVLSPDGSQVLFRVRRPFYWINSSIFIEDGSGAVVGEVHQHWHMWRRKYGLYLGKRQFAAIDGPLFAWEFVLRDENGGVVALIDRNFSGFGKELFTDAGKYVVHFGEKPAAAAEHVANTIAAAHPDKPRPPVTALAKARNELTVIPTATGDQLDVVRSLGITERSAVLAAAISIDFDFFSQHSSGTGMMPFFMPMPMPGYPAEGGADAGGAEGGGGEQDSSSGGATGAAGEAGAGAAGGAAAETAAESAGDDWGSDAASDSQWGGEQMPQSDTGEVNLGDDDWGSESQDSGWGEDLGGDGGDNDGGGLFGTLWDAMTDDS